MKVLSGWDRYMEGYDIQRAEIGPGHFKTEFVFTGDYRIFALTDRQFKLMKGLYAFAAVVLTVVYVLAATMTTSSYRINYVAIPAFVAVVPLVCLLYGVVGYILTPQRMTPRHYRASVQMTRYSSLIVLILLSATAIGHVSFLAHLHRFLSGQDLRYLVLIIIAVVLAAGIFTATVRIKIKTIYQHQQIVEEMCHA